MWKRSISKNGFAGFISITLLLILGWPSFVAAGHDGMPESLEVDLDVEFCNNTSLMPNATLPTNQTNQTIENNVSPNNSTNTTLPANLTNTSLANASLSNTTMNITCNLTFSISTDKELYLNKEAIKYQFHFSAAIDDFEIEYWIEDLNGELVRVKRTTTNANQKSFTPSIDVQEKVFWIKALFFPSCSAENASAEKLVIVHNPDAPFGGEEEGGADSPATKVSASPSSSTQASDEKGGKRKASIEYDLLYVPAEALNASEITTTLQITNHHEAHDFSVWSYVYSGSVSYSGHREQNKQSFHLDPWASTVVNLTNMVIANPGEYKIKIKIRKDEQKTTTDLTKILTILQPLQNVLVANDSAAIILNTSEAIAEQGLAVQPAVEAMLNVSRAERTAPTVLYESTTSKIRGIIIYPILAAFALVVIILVWKLG